MVQHSSTQQSPRVARERCLTAPRPIALWRKRSKLRRLEEVGAGTIDAVGSEYLPLSFRSAQGENQSLADEKAE